MPRNNEIIIRDIDPLVARQVIDLVESTGGRVLHRNGSNLRLQPQGRKPEGELRFNAVAPTPDSWTFWQTLKDENGYTGDPFSEEFYWQLRGDGLVELLNGQLIEPGDTVLVYNCGMGYLNNQLDGEVFGLESSPRLSPLVRRRSPVSDRIITTRATNPDVLKRQLQKEWGRTTFDHVVVDTGVQAIRGQVVNKFLTNLGPFSDSFVHLIVQAHTDKLNFMPLKSWSDTINQPVTDGLELL